MIIQLFKRFLAATTFVCFGFHAAAQELATQSPNGGNMTVSEFAGYTWRATSSGRGQSHVAVMDFGLQGNNLVGETIHWPNSGRTSKLVVESLSNSKLIATTVVKQGCGKSRKITYAVLFKKKSIRLKVSGPKSRCRAGTFTETGKLTRG